jgi:hypothetical protein
MFVRYAGVRGTIYGESQDFVDLLTLRRRSAW